MPPQEGHVSPLVQQSKVQKAPGPSPTPQQKLPQGPSQSAPQLHSSSPPVQHPSPQLGLQSASHEQSVSAPEQHPSPQLSLVQSVNAQRMEKYQQIANQKGVPVEQIGAIAGEKIIGKLKPGYKYMDSSGNWVTK